MNIFNNPAPPIMAMVTIIAFVVLDRLTRQRPFGLSQALLTNSLMACCFAGSFARAGWDKALIAFLFIFVITSLAAVCRWAEHHHFQEAIRLKESTKKVQT